MPRPPAPPARPALPPHRSLAVTATRGAGYSGFPPFLGAALLASARFPRRALAWAVRLASDQVRFTLVQAVPLLVVLAFGTGAAVALEVTRFADFVALSDTLGLVLALIIVRHFGPLLTTILIVGRSGTAVVTEMATVQFTGEVSALEALGIDPIHYYVYPRVLGGAVSTAAAMVIFDFAAVAGAWTVASTQEGMSLHTFLDAFLRAVTPADVVLTVVKGLVFGVGMILLCVHAGLSARMSPTQIPIAARRGVIRALLFVFLASVLFPLVPGVE